MQARKSVKSGKTGAGWLNAHQRRHHRPTGMALNNESSMVDGAWLMGLNGWCSRCVCVSSFQLVRFFPVLYFFFLLIFCFSYINYLEGHEYQDSNSSTSTSMGSRRDMSRATGMFLFLFSFLIMLMFIFRSIYLGTTMAGTVAAATGARDATHLKLLVFFLSFLLC